MPIFFFIIGSVFLISAVRGTHVQLGDLLKATFSGPGSFTSIVIALVALAGIGAWEPLRPLSRVLMILVLIVLFLSNSKGEDLLTLIRKQLGQAA